MPTRGEIQVCETTQTFVLYYADQTLYVFRNNNPVILFVLVLADQPYYVGFASSSAGSTSKQILSDWRINTNLQSADLSEYLTLPVQFPTLTSHPDYTEYQLDWSNVDLAGDFKYCGPFSGPVDGSIRLTKDFENQFGFVMFKHPVSVQNGFLTKFTWMQTDCDAQKIGAQGFSFFFSTERIFQCFDGQGFQLKRQDLPQIHSFEYSYGEVYKFCDRNRPDGADECTPHVEKRRGTLFIHGLQCNNPHQFVLYYDNNTLSAFVDGSRVLSTYTELKDKKYYIGFAASSGLHYSRQYVSNWMYFSNLTMINMTDYLPQDIYTVPPPVDPPVDTPIDTPTSLEVCPPVSPPIECPPVTICPPVSPPIVSPPIASVVCPPVQPPVAVQCPALPSVSDNFVFLGTARFINGTFALPGGSALLYNKRPLSPVERNAFVTSFTWTPTACDPVYNGADGWSFFMTKNIPTLQQVQSSAGSGLGIHDVPNTIMAAYSATFNEFWMANWTSPILGGFRWQVTYQVVSGPKYTCGGSYNFTISYDRPILKMRLENQVVISAQVDLDLSAPYYYGLSGGTGGGYFRQEFTNWAITHPLV